MDVVRLHSPDGMLFLERGDPTPAHLTHRECQREFIERYASPLPASPCVVNSICGSFKFVSSLPHSKAQRDGIIFQGSQYFGRHMEIYHVEGLLHLYHAHRLHFKGVKGYAAAERVAASLRLASAECKVHMVTASARLGKRVAISIGCFMEMELQERFPAFRPLCRTLDETMLRIRIPDFGHPDMPWWENPPLSADIKVSSMGAVMMLLKWDKVLWSQQIEDEARRHCEWIVQQLRMCC